MTLDGTRTFIIGRQTAAIIDPGPDEPAHLDAIAEAVSDADSVTILLTHRHPDHAAGATALAHRIAAISTGPYIASDGEAVSTEAGALHALATPGHTPDHCAYHWPAEHAIFCGDLMMGGIDTALVAWPEGNLTHYLTSLERLRSLHPRVVYPTHGPEFTMPDEAITAYQVHRYGRIQQVRQALAAGWREPGDIAEHVYGGAIPPDLRYWTEATIRAYLEHMVECGLLAREAWS